VTSRLRVMVSATAAAVALLAASWAAAPAVAQSESAVPSSTGWVRLAHLSPDTPEVDVYLTSFERADFREVFPGVGYGVVSDYQRLQPGRYNVEMRLAGDAESTPPVIAATADVQGGQAYTVAGLNQQTQLQLKVLSDDLTLPPADQAKVRVVNGSLNAPLVDVTLQNGPTVATDVAFANTSQYGAVPAGPSTLAVTPKQGATPPSSGDADLASGSVYSVLLLDKEGGAVEVVTRTDASAASAAAGGVATGFGGTAGGDSSMPMAVLAVGAGVMLAGALALFRILAPARPAGRYVGSHRMLG
jgi:Domain of unknown function (DUF4397)